LINSPVQLLRFDDYFVDFTEDQSDVHIPIPVSTQFFRSVHFFVMDSFCDCIYLYISVYICIYLYICI
jgi:hypothetical protein